MPAAVTSILATKSIAQHRAKTIRVISASDFTAVLPIGR
jgi:hypothetical protein